MCNCWLNFRRNGIKGAKSLISSAADLASDWVYYLRIKQNGPEQYVLYLFIFCIISSVMGLLLIMSLIANARQNRIKRQQQQQQRSGGGGDSSKLLRRKKLDTFNSLVKSVLGLEILLEDIPQFVLTTLITIELGQLTTYAVFNITLSGMNFILNLMDILKAKCVSSRGQRLLYIVFLYAILLSL